MHTHTRRTGGMDMPRTGPTIHSKPDTIFRRRPGREPIVTVTATHQSDRHQQLPNHLCYCRHHFHYQSTVSPPPFRVLPKSQLVSSPAHYPPHLSLTLPCSAHAMFVVCSRFSRSCSLPQPLALHSAPCLLPPAEQWQKETY